VIANVYEKDFAALHAGTGVTISAPSFPGRVFHGKVSYIDPRVDPQTRTAQARIEVPNPGGILRLGMFVDVALNTSGKSAAVAVPKTALQTVGNDTVIFVPLGAGKFQMRRVQVGQDAGEFVHILSGVTAGEKVVTAGSFFLRAEMARR
jgi:RND family efflux transporter MFP subunit